MKNAVDLVDEKLSLELVDFLAATSSPAVIADRLVPLLLDLVDAARVGLSPEAPGLVITVTDVGPSRVEGEHCRVCNAIDTDLSDGLCRICARVPDLAVE